LPTLHRMPRVSFPVTGDDVADRLLVEDPLALLIGMLLDQQVPMEKAFTGPLVIASRMGGSLDVGAIAAMSEDDFVALCSERPAIHRFPGAMAKRVRQVCQVLADEYEGQAGNVWKDAETGAEVKAALAKLPGFGLFQQTRHQPIPSADLPQLLDLASAALHGVELAINLARLLGDGVGNVGQHL